MSSYILFYASHAYKWPSKSSVNVDKNDLVPLSIVTGVLSFSARLSWVSRNLDPPSPSLSPPWLWSCSPRSGARNTISVIVQRSSESESFPSEFEVENERRLKTRWLRTIAWILGTKVLGTLIRYVWEVEIRTDQVQRRIWRLEVPAVNVIQPNEYLGFLRICMEELEHTVEGICGYSSIKT